MDDRVTRWSLLTVGVLGLGLSILSTPKGVLAGHEAWHEHVGGEVLCYVW